MFVCLFFLSHSISAALIVCIYLTVDGWPLCVSSVLYFMEPLLADTEREVKRRKSRRPVESNKKHRRRQQVLRWQGRAGGGGGINARETEWRRIAPQQSPGLVTVIFLEKGVSVSLWRWMDGWMQETPWKEKSRRFSQLSVVFYCVVPREQTGWNVIHNHRVWRREKDNVQSRVNTNRRRIRVEHWQ